MWGGVARKIKNGYIGVGGVARKFFSAITSPLYIYNAGTWSGELDVTGATDCTDKTTYLQQNSSTSVKLNCTIDVTDYSKLSVKVANNSSGTSYLKAMFYDTSGTRVASLTVNGGTTTSNYWTANFDISSVTGTVKIRLLAYNTNSSGTNMYGNSYYSQIYLTE